MYPTSSGCTSREWSRYGIVDVGIFWDFGSLHQKPRVNNEEVLFKEGTPCQQPLVREFGVRGLDGVLADSKHVFLRLPSRTSNARMSRGAVICGSQCFVHAPGTSEVFPRLLTLTSMARCDPCVVVRGAYCSYTLSRPSMDPRECCTALCGPSVWIAAHLDDG